MTDKITSGFGLSRTSVVGGLGYLYASLPVEASAAATVDLNSATTYFNVDCPANDSPPFPIWVGQGYLAGASPSGLAEVSGSPSSGVAIEAWTGGIKIPVTAVSSGGGTWIIDGLNPTLTYDVVGRFTGYDAEIYSGVTPSLHTLSLTGTIPTVHLLRQSITYLPIAGGSGIYSNAHVTSGTLPTGLALTIVGNNVVLSGFVTAAGSNPVTISVDSSDSQTATLTQSITVDHWYTSYFASGELGMVFDFGDISSLYQDTAATTVCTAAGQTVKAVKCKLTSLVLSNSTGNTLSQDSFTGRYFITFSGSAPYSITSGFPITGTFSAYSIAFSGGPTSTSQNTVLLAGPVSANTAGAEIYMSNTIFGNGTNQFSRTGVVGQQQLTGVMGSSLYNYYSTTIAAGAAVAATSPNLTNSAVHLGSDAAGANVFTGPMWWCMVINRVVTTAEIGTLAIIS